MASTKDRQRAAARARLAQEMALRQEAARRRRQRTTIISSAVACVVVIGLVVLIVMAATGGKKHSPAAASSASATPTNCTWFPNPDPSASAAANPDLKNTGSPPATGEPRSGTRDMTIDSNLGKIVIQLDVTHAPCTSESFTYLAGKGYFNNSGCHRLLNSSGTNSDTGEANEAHVLQCGDPTGTGQGGPSYTFADENLPTNQRPTYPAGSVAMANTGQANSNGSQFFIVYADTTLPANYTIFGKVTTGLDVVQKVAAGGDDGAFAQGANAPGGGHPKTKITFNTVTVGPVVGGSAAPSTGTSSTPSVAPTPSHS